MRRFLIPDLALTGAAFTLLYCLLFYDGARNLFRDSDSGWHIRNGEAILAEGKLPATDPYSFSKGGEPWFAWEWGSDVLMGAAHRGDGLSGVVLLYLAAIACCTWIWFRLHWEAGGDFLLACAMASPMLSTVNLHWLARPHVFGWVLALAWVLILERGIRSLTVAALLGAIWANAHGSFFLLPFIALAYAARDIRYLAVAAAGLAGTFVNPYGWKLHAHVFQYLSNGELLKRIGEFQTFNFHSEGAAQILLGVGIAALGASLALMQRNFTHFLVLAAMSAVALRSARGLPLLALLLPLANGAITRAWQESGLWPRLLAYSGNLRRLEMGFAGIAWAAVLLGVAFAVLHTPSVDARAGFDPAEFPVAASAIVESLPAESRILAPDKFGGYLIYRFAGRRKVFFDGRSDFYGAEFMKAYIDLVQVRPGWQNRLAEWKFTHALLPKDYSLATVLPLVGWRELYRDSTAVVLQGPNQ